MVRKTLEEYKAEALLLGMQYDRKIHTFFVVDDSYHGFVEFDADTMEPLSFDDVQDRYKRKRKERLNGKG